MKTFRLYYDPDGDKVFTLLCMLGVATCLDADKVAGGGGGGGVGTPSQISRREPICGKMIMG